MKRVFRRPSPAMVVAIVALIAALGGTAVAGGFITKKKAKSIANNVVTQRAPGLSVASANSANSASSVVANAIGSGQVANGSLTGDDVGINSGNLAGYDAPNVPADDCIQDIQDLGVSEDLRDAAFAVTMDQDWPLDVVFSTENSDSVGFIRINICNPTAAAVNPPATTLHWVAFNSVN